MVAVSLAIIEYNKSKMSFLIVVIPHVKIFHHTQWDLPGVRRCSNADQKMIPTPPARHLAWETNNEHCQTSQCKETVERSSGDTFWWLCRYAAVEELQTSGQGYWLFNGHSDAYCHISSSFILLSRAWWECPIFLASPKSAQNRLEWKQVRKYISLWFGLPGRLLQCRLSPILS